MRLFIATSFLLLSAGAFATESVVATDYSCSELKAMVKERGVLTIETKMGEYVTYPNGMSCFEQGMKTKYVTVQTRDRMCVAGLECDIYSGGSI